MVHLAAGMSCRTAAAWNPAETFGSSVSPMRRINRRMPAPIGSSRERSFSGTLGASVGTPRLAGNDGTSRPEFAHLPERLGRLVKGSRPAQTDGQQ
jgi:hypothetical protein